ncbi:hypothetical protein LV779_25550 [Streptomyces thinghirensis]|nr:hypothetical protein [Streptomyces thinghirensis]
METYWGLTVTVPETPKRSSSSPHAAVHGYFARPAVFGPLDDIALHQTPAASGTLYGVEASPDVIRQRMLQHREINVLRDRPRPAHTA